MGSLGEDSDEEVLYHQLATEETEEEVRGKKKKIFRPRLNRNTIMELSIHNRRLFFLCLLVVEAFGISAVILTVHWAINIKDGVGYVENMGIPFNWHPILMTLSLIFLYGNGALIYRVIPPRNDAHKLKLKLAHAGIMIVAFVLMVIGLQAAFDSHNKANPPKPNMYTLHSWIGLLAALLFGCQWALGFLPFHQYFGSAILDMAVAAACMGHLEKMIWSNKAGYVAKDTEAQIVNTTGLFLILFAIGVTLLLSKFSKDQKPGVASK